MYINEFHVHITNFIVFNACSENSAVLTFVLLYAYNIGYLELVSVV